MPAHIIAAFEDRFGRRPTVVTRAPGRVALLGAHVDYSDGLVLPAAIDRSIWVAAAPAAGTRGTLVALDPDESGLVDWESLPPPRPERSPPGGTWLDLPLGVAWALRRRGRRASPIDAVFGGDLPPGRGLSSSAAVEVAFCLAWEKLGDGTMRRMERARLCREVENEYLGLGSGLMDPFASIHGRRDQALLLDCRTETHEALPFPRNAEIVVADSGVRRTLARSGFNERRRECDEAVARIAERYPKVKALRDVTPGILDEVEPELPPALARRTRHAVEEIARVAAGARALSVCDLESFGELMKRSHESSRDLYEVSVPELDMLAEAAWAAEGCYGARLTGGGFGGCVLAVVAEGAAASVAAEMSDRFDGRFHRRPDISTVRIGAGAAVEWTSGPTPA